MSASVLIGTSFSGTVQVNPIRTVVTVNQQFGDLIFAGNNEGPARVTGTLLRQGGNFYEGEITMVTPSVTVTAFLKGVPSHEGEYQVNGIPGTVAMAFVAQPGIQHDTIVFN